MVTKKIYSAYYKSPIGWIRIQGDGRRILGLEFVSKRKGKDAAHPSLLPAYRQLKEYFSGKRKRFLLKLGFDGTSFQRAVWSTLQKIPFAGKTSYQKVSSAIGRRKAVRAAGTAIGKNRFAIVVPCHRVVASSGDIAGYAGGVWRKKWLLQHESKISKKI